MKGYWIATYRQIDNLEKLNEYAEFIRTVIWEFPSFNKALECHNSAEYQEKWDIVKETCKRNLQIVEGFNTE